MTTPANNTVEAKASPLTRLWRRLLCRLGWHDYRLIAHLGMETDRIGCLRCRQQWGMHHGLRTLVPWCEVERFYQRLGYRP